MDTVQRGFAHKIIKSYRTVSLNATLVLSGLIPLDLMHWAYEAKRGRLQHFLTYTQLFLPTVTTAYQTLKTLTLTPTLV